MIDGQNPTHGARERCASYDCAEIRGTSREAIPKREESAATEDSRKYATCRQQSAAE
jgi:hypothetical protein